jgi:hypothetical protein
MLNDRPSAMAAGTARVILFIVDDKRDPVVLASESMAIGFMDVQNIYTHA